MEFSSYEDMKKFEAEREQFYLDFLDICHSFDPFRFKFYKRLFLESFHQNASGEEMSGMTLAKRFKTTLVEMGVKRLTVKSRIRIGEVWTKELSDEAELNMRKQLFGSQY